MNKQIKTTPLVSFDHPVYKNFFNSTEPYHYENMPIQIYWKFYHQKKWIFSD